jgi:drug/metabolite transporter, DME family
MRSHAAAGTLAVLAAAILWGSIGVLGVAAFRAGLTPWEVAFWRAALGGAALAGWAALVRRDLFLLPERADVLRLAAFGSVAVGLFYASYQLAVYHTTVAVAVVLLYTAPVMVVVGARITLGEPLDRWKVIMAIAVLAGVAAVSAGAAGGAQVRLSGVGVMWGLLSAATYATYYLFGKRHLPRLGVGRILLWSLLFGTLALWGMMMLIGAPPDMAALGRAPLPLILLALGATLLANGVYYWGLSRIEAGRASLLASVEPVVAALLGWVVAGQALAPLGIAGVVLVTAGVALTAVAGSRRQARPSSASPSV